MNAIVNVVRRTGNFGPNRWHEITLPGGDQFLLSYVGSGAVCLRAVVESDGGLSLPRKGAEWGISLSSTSGGKVGTVPFWVGKNDDLNCNCRK